MLGHCLAIAMAICSGALRQRRVYRPLRCIERLGQYYDRAIRHPYARSPGRHQESLSYLPGRACARWREIASGGVQRPPTGVSCASSADAATAIYGICTVPSLDAVMRKQHFAATTSGRDSNALSDNAQLQHRA